MDKGTIVAILGHAVKDEGIGTTFTTWATQQETFCRPTSGAIVVSVTCAECGEQVQVKVLSGSRARAKRLLGGLICISSAALMSRGCSVQDGSGGEYLLYWVIPFFAFCCGLAFMLKAGLGLDERVAHGERITDSEGTRKQFLKDIPGLFIVGKGGEGHALFDLADFGTGDGGITTLGLGR